MSENERVDMSNHPMTTVEIDGFSYTLCECGVIKWRYKGAAVVDDE